MDKLVSIGGKLKTRKSADGLRGYVEGLGVRFSTHDEPDLEGEFFDAKTYYGKRLGDGVDATLNHTFPIQTDNEEVNQQLEQLANKTFANEVESEQVDYGLIGKHVLNLADDFEAWVFKMVEEGAFRWSTAPTGTTVKTSKMGSVSHIDRWDIGEWAYTPTPAEPRLPRIAPLKSLNYKFPADAVRAKGQAGDADKKNLNNGENEMTKEEIQALIAAALKEHGDGQPDMKTVIADTVKSVLENQESPDIEAAVKKAVDEAIEAYKAALPPDDDPGFDAPNVAKMKNLWKYDHMSVGEHALALTVLNAAAGQKNIGGGMVQPGSLAMAKSLAIKVLADKQTDIENRPLHSRSKAAMGKAFGVGLTDKQIHAAKADELNYSTQAGYGDEWIGVAYANELWPRIVQDTPIINKIPTLEVPQGAESVTIPLDGSPPTFYNVAQATSMGANPGDTTKTVPVSKQATGQQSLTLGKAGAAVTWTGEISEDAVVNFASELRRNIQQEAAEVMEHMAIDGDTDLTALTNINDIGGTPAGTEAFTILNGFRKLALVTNTANSRDGGVLALTDFLETIKLMGLAGRNALQKDKIGFILDLWTHWKALELAQIATQDVYSAPTIERGELLNIYGYGVTASANMHRANQDATYGLKSNSAGKLDLDTALNNTKGAMLAVRWDQWRWGFKRRVSFEVERVARADAYELTALFRAGMIYRDTEAAAISYNLTL